jgi:hypothetical protein
MSFSDVLTAAVNDLTQNGYTSPEQVAEWQRRLREASRDLLLSDAELDALLRESLFQVYGREVDLGAILRRNPCLDRFTYERIKPHLRAEAVNKMQRRFTTT